MLFRPREPRVCQHQQLLQALPPKSPLEILAGDFDGVPICSIACEAAADR